MGAWTPLSRNGFAIKRQDRSASERDVTFADVKSVKAIQTARGRRTWIVAGVAIPAVAGAVTLGVYLAALQSLGRVDSERVGIARRDKMYRAYGRL